jgi:hypothetical protein
MQTILTSPESSALIAAGEARLTRLSLLVKCSQNTDIVKRLIEVSRCHQV